MMICPLSVFEELKDKPEKEIRTAIRGYKNQIGRLKKILEKPNFEEVMCPSHELQLQMNAFPFSFNKLKELCEEWAIEPEID